MKKYLLPLIGLLIFLAPQAHAVSWSFYRSITVTSTASVASGTNANFPMLVSSTFSSWASSGHSGNVQNLCTAPSGAQEPCDLVFATSTANCTAGSYLNFETESYSSSTGLLIDWVNVPSISTGTVIYACYDASAVSTDQSHPSSTWNSNYKAVYHLPNGTTLTANDSTNNANNGTLQNTPNAVTGQIDGGSEIQRGPGIDQYITAGSGSSLNITGKLITIEAWFKRNNTAMISNNTIFQRGIGGSGGYEFDVSGSATSTSFTYLVQGVAGISVGAISDDTNWHHVVLLSDNSIVGVYVDGVLTAGTNASVSIQTVSTTASIGPANSASLNNDYNLDEVRVSNTNRSPAWILTEYNNQLSPSTFYTVGAETAFGGGGSTTVRRRYTMVCTAQ